MYLAVGWSSLRAMCSARVRAIEAAHSRIARQALRLAVQLVQPHVVDLHLRRICISIATLPLRHRLRTCAGKTSCRGVPEVRSTVWNCGDTPRFMMMLIGSVGTVRWLMSSFGTGPMAAPLTVQVRSPSTYYAGASAKHSAVAPRSHAPR